MAKTWERIVHLKMAASVMDILKGKMASGNNAVLPKLYDGSDTPPLPILREYLGQYPGGSVDLACQEDGIATITINQPDKRNAISGKMMGDLHDVVAKLEDWKEGKGVIVRGEKGNFCSGGDLDMARGTGSAQGGYYMATFMNNVLDRFQALPFINVALIEGCGALGGGSEVSIACDMRLMSPSCRGIGFVHGRMAIVPAWGGSRRLVNAVGYRNALRILTTAKVYRPEEALQNGLIDEITPADKDPYEFAIEWIKQHTSFSPSVIQGIKTTAVLAATCHDSAEMEKRIFAPFWGSPGNRAALQANIKHRPQ